MPAMLAGGLLTREDFLADEPGESIDPPFKKLALALCSTFLNPATPANSTEISTTPLGRSRDLFLGDNLDLGLEATRAAI